MSRTYRRKNSTWSMSTYDCNWIDGILIRVNYAPNSKEYAKCKVNFHRENRRSGHSVPGWFVTVYCETKFREKTKQEIYRWLKNPDNYECMHPEFIRDAGWMYF